jgi:hypothetical protein
MFMLRHIIYSESYCDIKLLYQPVTSYEFCKLELEGMLNFMYFLPCIVINLCDVNQLMYTFKLMF